MLHSPLTATSSLELRRGEGSNSQKKHRASASLGKTHFKLAPGLLETHHSTSKDILTTPSLQSYDEQWQRWMAKSNSQHGLSRFAYSPYESLNYTTAWTNWMSRHSPKQAQPEPVLFEEVPREDMLPIMSRLPLDDGEEDLIAAEPTKDGNVDYLTTDSGYNGLHPEKKVAATPRLYYTRARLPELDDESYHLWNSLHSLRPLSDDYADGYEAAAKPAKKIIEAPHPISDDMDATQCPAFNLSTSQPSQRALALVKKLFNWDQLPDLPVEDEYTWYGVAFRSKRKAGSESMNLYSADRISHEEAVHSGGLLMYWYGRPNPQTGHNLATCIWTSRSEALKASALPMHARAAVHARKAYESFELNRYALRKVRGETKLRLEEWIE